MLPPDAVAKTRLDTKTIEEAEGDTTSQIYVGVSQVITLDEHLCIFRGHR